MELELKLHYIALILLLNAKGEVLLARMGNIWGLLGGHVEPTDGSREGAATREVEEEAQLKEITGKKRLFRADEVRQKGLYMFDVDVGHCYDERPPGFLLKEKISETRWWSIEATSSLILTPMAIRAIDSLREKKDRSFFTKCQYHFESILYEAALRGCDRFTLLDLKKGLEKNNPLLDLINKIPDSDKLSNQQVEFEKIIVMVDDDEYTILTVRKMLLAEGYRVFIFSDPREALRWLENSTIYVHALITDQNMPYISGSGLLKKVQVLESVKYSKFILISGAEVFPAEKEGFDNFFVRPVLPEELIRAIS
ncbi:MAG: NUDIX domain-containing protein [Candidatus Paceibacterota bacterium]|jgi:CheY-like chemotaxis protein